MKLALLFLGLVICLASHESVLFQAWKAKYNKLYASADEEAVRLNNFKLSLDRIQSRNARSTNPVYGLTKYSDMSTDEFKNLLGYIRPAHRADVPVDVFDEHITAPQNWDWRPKNMVTAVKDQGQCGSCWAFSVTETIESGYCMTGPDCTKLPPLAPQEIVDCDTAGNDQGCEGGDPPSAYQFVITEGGMEDESNYPYAAADGTCNFTASLVVITISGFKYATQNSNEPTMQQSLLTAGPLSICVDAEPWQDYTSGVMMASDCSNTLDHCVQLVGYDMTQSTPFLDCKKQLGC